MNRPSAFARTCLSLRRLRRVTSLLLGTPLVLSALSSFAALPAHAATPAELLTGYTAQAGSPAQPVRGESLFTQKHGREWSCASCHGARPVQAGQHAGTGKAIAALAPNTDSARAVQPARFTDAAKTEKWFRRNCNDVMGRECTPAEKADVLAWLMSLKP